MREVFISILLSLFFILTGISLFARQQPIPMSSLLEMGKWHHTKIEAFLKTKGFNLRPSLYSFGTDSVDSREFGDTNVIGYNTAPAPEEGDPEIKREFFYYGNVIRKREGSATYVEYSTTDPAEHDIMKEYLEANDYFLDPQTGSYFNGQSYVELKYWKEPLNNFHRGLFKRKYVFEMYTSKSWFKKEGPKK